MPFIFFTEYDIFSKMATFVGNKRLDSRPKILWFGTTYTSFKEISFNRPFLNLRKPCQNPAPFINKELRKAVYKKRQLHNKYNKCKTKSNWENYRQQRNLGTKIKKKSIKNWGMFIYSLYESFFKIWIHCVHIILIS
jgi:hypothetical protein